MDAAVVFSEHRIAGFTVLPCIQIANRPCCSRKEPQCRLLFPKLASPRYGHASKVSRLEDAMCPESEPTFSCRAVSTSKLTEVDAQSLLAAQRKSRPVAPHLQIYDKSQTYFGGSIWTRITGSIFSGSLYTFGAAYLVAPLFGWHLESATLAAAFGSLPVAVKGGLKFLIAWPFVFHSLNGVRHLTWDLAKGFSKSSIKTFGTAIWGVSLVSALGLAFYL